MIFECFSLGVGKKECRLSLIDECLLIFQSQRETYFIKKFCTDLLLTIGTARI